jgi:hypothetical protein
MADAVFDAVGGGIGWGLIFHFSGEGSTNMVAAAIALQIVLLVYHQSTTLLDFFPFNGARFYSRGERIGEAGVNLVLMSLSPIGFVTRVPWMMGFGAAYYFVLLAVEIATWWVPYFFGASAKNREVYSRIHARTVQVLPQRGENPRPNLEHLILMCLTLATAIVTSMAYRVASGVPFQHWLVAMIVGAAMVSGTVYQFSLAGQEKSVGAKSEITVAAKNPADEE